MIAGMHAVTVDTDTNSRGGEELVTHRSGWLTWTSAGTIVAVGSLAIALLAWLYPRSPAAGEAAKPSPAPTTATAAPEPPASVTTSPAPAKSKPDTETPEAETEAQPEPAATTHQAARTAKSKLYVEADGSFSQYKAGPGNMYQADQNIKFTVRVSDDVGAIESDCYDIVTIKRADRVIDKHSVACYPGYGWVRLPAGSYTLQFDVTTEWGAKGRDTIQVEMVST